MKYLIKITVVIGGILFTGFSFFGYKFVASKPLVDGQVKVAGPNSTVRLIRDPQGVPHIFAERDLDVFFGLGFAHAQDRFFQMDLTRRLVNGRLCELVGEKALAMDAIMRIKGYNKIARSITSELNENVRAAAQAYADGVNARLKQGNVAPEYAFLLASPEPWQIEDSVSAALAMTDNLVGGLKRELAKAVLTHRLGREATEEFFPGYPQWAPRSVAESEVSSKKINAVSKLNFEVGEGAIDGSNAWVLGGERTTTGKPILANDPHLALASPGPFYLVHLQLRDGAQVGATLPGAPLVVIGRNEHIAWSNTTNQVDAEDVIEEPAQGFKIIDERDEVIRIREKLFSFREEKIHVRLTDQGPILDPKWFDLSGYIGKTVALKSVALDPHNGLVNAVWNMGRSKSAAEFIKASEPWSAPLTNILVADLDGNIGLVSTGKIPKRDAGGKWIGSIEWKDQPNFLNPRSHYFATANNLITPQNYPYQIPGQYAVYRHARIHELIEEKNNFSMNDVETMQLDQVSIPARRLVPLMLKNLVTSDTETQKSADLLAKWNFSLSADSFEALLFAEWLKTFSKAVYADELGDVYADRAKNPKPEFIEGVLTGASAKWCDDVATAEKVENCDEIKSTALTAAVASLRQKFGADFMKAKWGDMHRAQFKHPLFTGAPLLDKVFTTRVNVGGDTDTVFPTVYSYEKDYAAYHGPGLRVVFDFSDLQRSKFMLAPGQSGNPVSAHYDDLVNAWVRGQNFEIRTDFDPNRPPQGFSVLNLVPQ